MILLLLLAGALIGIDQAIKFWATTVLQPVQSMPLIPKIVELYYQRNDGAAFSILSGQQTLLIVITSIALLVLAFFLFVKRRSDKMEEIGFLLIFAGGVGNLIDRIAQGFVVDYINLLFLRFAVFNFADCCVTIGFVVLVTAFIRQEIQSRKARTSEGEHVESPSPKE